MDFSANLQKIRSGVQEAINKSPLGQRAVEIIVVTKGRHPEDIKLAYNQGIRTFAENKVREAEAKVPALGTDVKWHMIGHLQTNKTKDAVRLFSMIQSLDSVRLAEKIDRECRVIAKIMPVLLEVNISGEEQKYGFRAQGIKSAIEQMRDLKNIRIEGFMGMAPLTSDHAVQKKCFSVLKKIYDECQGIRQDNVQMRYLSMGMSDDFRTAVEEGSNMVRIGRALFV